MHSSLLETIPVGIIEVTLDGIVSYVNQYALTSLGAESQSDIEGKHYSEVYWLTTDMNGQSLKSTDNVFFKVLDRKTSQRGEVQGAMVEGSVKWYSLSTSPLMEGEKMSGAVLNFEDITAAKERSVDADRYKILLENIDGVVWESGFDTKTFTYISPKVESLFGFPQNEWLKEGFWQSRIYGPDKEHVLTYETQKAIDAANYELEYRLFNIDGELRWIRDSVNVIRDGDKPLMLRGMMLDITEKKNAQNELKKSAKRFRELMDEAPYAITVYDRNGMLISANAKCEAYWMIDLKSYVGSFNVFDNDIFVEESQIEKVKETFKGQSGEMITNIHLPHTGKDKNFRIKYYPLFDSEDQIENVIYFTEDITQYVQAGEDIRYEESLKQGILNALDQAILVVDERGKIINSNQKLRFFIEKTKSIGLEVGDSIFHFMRSLNDEDVLKKGLDSILNKEANVIDHEMKMADGRWYSVRATPLVEPAGAVITWQNINTRKEIEMALEKSLRKYRNIYNKAPVMMHSINEREEIVSVSDFWLEKMGYDRNEVIGKSPMDFLVDKSKPDITSNFKKLFTEGFVRNAEYTFRKKNEQDIEVLLSAVAEYDEEGKFERSITGMLDVTDLKKTERKLQESQSKLLESQRISKIANYEYDTETGSLDPSEEMVAMMGFSNSEKEVSIIERLIHPDDVNEFKRKLEDSVEKGKDFFHIYRIFHLKNASLKWISGRGKMIKDEDGKVVKMIGTVQDISEQKNAEQKIKKLTDRVLLATEIANLGVWEYDRDEDEIVWEDQMYSIFPEAKSPLKVDELATYFIDADDKVIQSSLEMIKSGVNFLESEIKIHAGGQDKYLRAFTRVLRDQRGKLKGMVGVVYDISIDKNLQRQLEDSLEEKNVLIKEVHHRVKNNMQLISSILALKSYELDSEKSKVIFEEINDRIKAMAVIHDKLYTFYNVSEIDISEYLNHLAKELQTILLSADFMIEVKSDHVIFDVEKALLIGLIVSEMVGNAVKHGFKNRTDGVVTVEFRKLDNGHQLRVLNNGDQMESNVVDSSTGLGISLIKTFAKQLSGKLTFDSENGLKVHF